MPPSISVCSLNVGTLVLQWEQQGKEAGWFLDSNTYQSHKPPAAEDTATKYIKQGGSRRMVFLTCFAFTFQNESVTWWEMKWKKQVPNIKPKVVFSNVYLLFSFSVCLKFLRRTLRQTGKDDIACFEGILEKIQEQLKKIFPNCVWKEKELETVPFSLHHEKPSFLMWKWLKSLAGALLIWHPDQGSKLHVKT